MGGSDERSEVGKYSWVARWCLKDLGSRLSGLYSLDSELCSAK